jgi:hypothetical protein
MVATVLAAALAAAALALDVSPLGSDENNIGYCSGPSLRGLKAKCVDGGADLEELKQECTNECENLNCTCFSVYADDADPRCGGKRACYLFGGGTATHAVSPGAAGGYESHLRAFSTSMPLGNGQSAEVTGDPHFVGGDGDNFAFRGRNYTTYALHSSHHLAVNGRFEPQVFFMGGTCATCNQKTVYGSFVTRFYAQAKTSSGKMVRVTYLADAPSRAELAIVDAEAGEMAAEVKVATLEKDSAAKRVDELSVLLVRKHAREATLTVANREFEVSASSRYLLWAQRNGHRKRLDIAIKPLKEVATLDVAPHGLIGQTLDGDGVAIDGALDDYSTKVVVTKAMGEGAIEGAAVDYEIRDVDGPFSPNFKFSRFWATTAAPRDTSALTGSRRVVKKGQMQAAGILGDDLVANDEMPGVVQTEAA